MIHEQKAQASAQKSKAAEKSKERHSHRTDGSRCPICGAEISSRFEICPECGGKLVSYCTFCGADMDRNDTECPECGMPAGGVKCPECGTLNHRSFCSKCNTPLTRAAQKAVQKALEDPKKGSDRPLRQARRARGADGGSGRSRRHYRWRGCS